METELKLNTILQHYSEEDVLEIMGYYDGSNPCIEGMSKGQVLIEATENGNFEYLFLT